MTNQTYSVEQVSKGLTQALNQYLEAQYHIWDDHLLRERQRLLNQVGVTHQTPYLEATPSYVLGKPYSELPIPQFARDILTFASTVDSSGVFAAPYLHQEQALVAFLRDEKDLIVATGTGSGKTEAFLMPILGQLAIEANSTGRASSKKLTGMRALLLYPMNALVSDQVSRLRRLVGNPTIAAEMRKQFGRTVRFGMYTGRTPYPGRQTDSKNESRLRKLVDALFRNLTPATRKLLEKEGKWPAKDMEAFVANDFKTSGNDTELYSRQEIQAGCPDILVTNYSMLEYMLLRPIERSIFDQTSAWLNENDDNQFTVVIDEAHMYRGAVGAEVAMLLRRFQSRLGVGRKRFRYILTSASLGSSVAAKASIKQFAADLTGLPPGSSGFELITGTIEKSPISAKPLTSDVAALAAFRPEILHAYSSGIEPAIKEFNALLAALQRTPVSTSLGLEELREAVFEFLRSYGPAGQLVDLITGNPMSFDELMSAFEVVGSDGAKAMESLFALSTFGQRSFDRRVFLPIRLHLFYRGFSSIHACTNPKCSARVETSVPSILGRLFDGPRLVCDCGARVFELLTHRDCGAAYLRGFYKDENGNFVWHESASSASVDGSPLIPVEFLVETNRHRDSKSHAAIVWLHIYSGQIRRNQPSDLDEFLPLYQPPLNADTRMHAFSNCPVCMKRQGESKIMDLVTKGEAPFAHLIKNQVQLQPATKESSTEFPNGGRKSLIFSDGRQKAARLARDIPRETEKDVFRQLIALAAQELDSASVEPLLSRSLFTAFVHVVAQHNVVLFDGEGKDDLLRIVANYRSDYPDADDLREAVNQGADATNEYWAALMRQIGPGHYSMPALTLAYVEPSAAARKNLKISFPKLESADLDVLANIWIQGLLNRFAFNVDLPLGVRIAAGAYGPVSVANGFQDKDRNLLVSFFPDLDQIEAGFQTAMANPGPSGIFLRHDRLRLRLAHDKEWFRCQECTAVMPFSLRGRCSNCGGEQIEKTSTDQSEYLRARKTFWRDPVVNVLDHLARPFNVSVEEHTAQLGHRDVDDPTSTTEEFERRFRDIISPGELPVDVLSSTTTMEVGIDIGSLVAVALRNVPPMRQNYQQRAGRTGRRGAAVSTVITFAQNSPHDHHYFENPKEIIAGDPPLPAIDVRNPKIVARHLRAALIQRFFHDNLLGVKDSNNLFSMLGDTWEFFQNGGEEFTLSKFSDWLNDADRDTDTFPALDAWIPDGVGIISKLIGQTFIEKLTQIRPITEEQLGGDEENLIEFLFARGLLPSYAFPRDICAFQIEQQPRGNKGVTVRIVERPQQGLNVALTEYAPGRLVVVNKKTYRIGSVTASVTSNVRDRAAPLFATPRTYRMCPECSYTQSIAATDPPIDACPLCAGNRIYSTKVIQPAVVYPQGRKEIDELDDEQIITHASAAQFPVVSQVEQFEWSQTFAQAIVTAAQNQLLVMVNAGQMGEERPNGFWVCQSCGKTHPDDSVVGIAHERDYWVEMHGQRQPGRCNGEWENVFLGYSFLTDVMLMRVDLVSPLAMHVTNRVFRRPLEAALISLADAISMAAAHILDIDPRELSGGHRFIKIGKHSYADLYLFDTLAGGAGYAHIAEKKIGQIFDDAELRLSKCTCDQSCHKCLRHYGNQFRHADLDRHLALDLIRYIRSGQVPQIVSIAEQKKTLDPLRYMMRLEGWTFDDTSKVPLAATKDGRRIALGVLPSLLDSASVDIHQFGVDRLVSEFDIKRNLPGIFSSVETWSHPTQ